MTDKQFIQHVRDEAALHNINVRLEKVPYLISGRVKCGGCFNEFKIAVATKKPHCVWFSVFAHEYSHMQQWYQKSKLWNMCSCAFYNGLDVYQIFDNWLSGTDYPQNIINTAITRVRNLELDCEKRTVRTITKHCLLIDMETYLRQSNAYVFFYEVARRHRVWMKPGKLYCTNKPLMEAAPTEFLPVSQYSRVEDYPELYRQLILASERIF